MFCRVSQGREEVYAPVSEPTLWKQACIPIDRVLPQEPPVSELIVTLEQLNTVTLRQGQLVGTTSLEVIYASDTVSHRSSPIRDMGLRA